MGQQQLLLLVLSLILVVAAVVAGLFMFDENMRKTNADALVSDAINVANQAQAWKIRPAAFGGQPGESRNNPTDFTGFSFQSVALNDPHVTLHGSFSYRSDERGLVIIGSNEKLGTRVTLTVSGITDRDIIAVVSSTDETAAVAESYAE
ncbi:MAG: hypothetical protein SH809_01160 [Rhodothermales bacterium]|nr:hypothetical protein [Rhodothermales bacterium]